MFFNKGFACLHFCWIEQVDLGNFGGEVRTKFDGMVIGVMGGKLVMGFLRENICKALAPFRYCRLNGSGGLGDLGGDGGFIDLFSFQPCLSLV